MNRPATNLAKPFAWAEYFETGFGEVDQQHQKLVDLINRLGERLASGRALSGDELDHVLGGLRKYAALHFSTEEQMMSSSGIDQRHFDTHCRAHSEFVGQIDALACSAANDQRGALPELLRYVSSWLALHILGIDMAMARQLHAIATGKSAAEAFEHDSHAADPANTALISAVHTLYSTVAERNTELIKAQAELENRVAERTAELREMVLRLEAAREQIVQTEKMAALGQFAAGMAHELNTPLGYIGGNLNALGDYCTRLLELNEQADGLIAAEPHAAQWRHDCEAADRAFIREDMPELLSESRTGLERISRIVDALRRSAVGIAELPVTTDLNSIINQAILRHMPALPVSIRIDCACDAPVATLVSPHALGAAVDEILDNAIKALSEQGGLITCTTGSDASHAWLEIADTGPGVDGSIAEHIFEPFFTTRAVGDGAGLGLYLAYQTARQHGGHIELRGNGAGATFRLVIPRAAGAAEPRVEASEHRPHSAAGART
ncbi:MAG: hypothetical protein CVU28_06100 [Betaproteobacteria bacterium HGW-Betaproteobacteria-21]|nr:MAG: hypothetical protein CVU28_06100 [Betaproteobacteria bacterium HGW-Betaproteobacteria-21]